MKPMTPKQFAEKMRKLKADKDVERRHGQADDLLCECLESLGYRTGVKRFRDMEKWYA